MNGFLYTQFPWIIWMIAITVQSSFHGISVPDLGITFTDKILHFVVFGILGLLITRGMRFSKKQLLKSKPVLTAVILGCLFALSDEVHQAFVPSRSAEVLDWVADFAGIVIFSYLYSRWLHKKELAFNSRG